jgi:lipopolysaccharide transport system permease protein
MFLAAPIVAILRHRELLWRTTIADLRSTYAGSVIGAAWVFLGPLLMLSVYALVYAVIFRVRITGMTVAQYVLYVFCGLVPFLAFASALTAGALSLAGNRHVLLNTVFPAELIPVRSVLVAAATMPASIVILFVADLIFSDLSLTFLLVPVIMLLELMFIIGLCWILSLLTLLVRDIQQLIYYITMVLLVITPIAYTPDMVPEQLKVLMYFNPLYYYVIAFQQLVILDVLPDVHVAVIGIGMSVGLFAAGYAVCTRTKHIFYDLA